MDQTPYAYISNAHTSIYMHTCIGLNLKHTHETVIIKCYFAIKYKIVSFSKETKNFRSTEDMAQCF